MFKLVVLCVFAVAFAEPQPDVLLGSPWAYQYPAVIPATTTITKQSSIIAHPSPIYSTPYAYSHLIKKRSADPEPEAKPQLLTYASPSIYYPNTLSTPLITNPFLPGFPAYRAELPLATHLIKKRSAQFLSPTAYLPSSYVPSTYVPSTYALPSYNPYYPTTYLGAGGAVVGVHSIKKRSPDTLIAPATYAAAPLTYAAASPLYTSTYAAASPLVSTLPYIGSPYAFSSFIKK